MNYHCYCQRDVDSMAIFGAALRDVLTDRYLIFRKQEMRKILWFWYSKDIEINLRVPKHYEDNYREKIITFLKEGISLSDRGFYNPYFDDQNLEKAKQRVAEYQMQKNKVWE